MKHTDVNNHSHPPECLHICTDHGGQKRLLTRAHSCLEIRSLLLIGRRTSERWCLNEKPMPMSAELIPNAMLCYCTKPLRVPRCCKLRPIGHRLVFIDGGRATAAQRVGVRAPCHCPNSNSQSSTDAPKPCTSSTPCYQAGDISQRRR